MQEIPRGSAPAGAAVVNQGRENLQGALLMLIATSTFVGNDTVMKYVTQELPLYQSMVLRGVFVLIILSGYALLTGTFSLRIPRGDWGNLGWRTVGEVGSAVTYLLALMHMPLANLGAILQVLPLLVTLAAGLFFGERLGPRRLIAIAIGFVGVMVILRPGTGAFDFWSLVALISILLIALRDLITRRFSRGVSSMTISLYAAFSVMAFALIMSVAEGWQALSLRHLGLLILAAVLITAGYLTTIATMRVGEISFVAPFRYTSLVWAVILGLVVFGEWPDIWTQFGASLIVAAGIYTILREGQLQKRARSRSLG